MRNSIVSVSELPKVPKGEDKDEDQLLVFFSQPFGDQFRTARNTLKDWRYMDFILSVYAMNSQEHYGQ